MPTNANDLVGIIIVITLLGVAPIAIMTLTSFTKIVIVLTLVRNALGVQQVPSNILINGIALVLTIYILMPLGATVYQAVASERGSLTDRVTAGLDAGREPFRAFLSKHTNERERRYFISAAAGLWPPEIARSLRGEDFIVLAPAFVVSELTEAFRIGFLIYIAFVIIDLVVANVLVALGLQQASPTNIAIPFKLLLFVALDGWSLLLNGIVSTYR